MNLKKLVSARTTALLAALLAGSVSGAFGQAAPFLGAPAPASLERSWNAAAEDQPSVQEQAALQRVRQILSRGGAVDPADKAFVNEWFPKLLASGAAGRAPDADEKSTVEGWFPKLARNGGWRVTGEACNRYNCISWSVGVTGEWLWPSDRTADFDAFYLSYGYVPLAKGESQDDADVALWAAADGTATHGCRRVAGDIWESKLGSSLRILHRLGDLEGDTYGHLFKFYRHATPAELAKLGVTPKSAGADGSDPCAARMTTTHSLLGRRDLGSPFSNKPR